MTTPDPRQIGCGGWTPPSQHAKEKADDRLAHMACSRIPDPEGKHLEVCRLQLAATVERLEVCREWIAWCSHEWAHRRIEDWPPKLIAAARAVKLIPENADVLAPAGEKTPTKPENE